VSKRKFIGRCRTCGRLVREDDSHVMVVPEGEGRIFFHAGCEPIKRTRDHADERLKTEPQEPPQRRETPGDLDVS
jgi:hypothetical protein